MNYIVIDLEWNQSPRGRENQNDKIPFEIIEIGAVKLNENRDKISEFSEIIKPQVYEEINIRTQEIIHVKMSELSKGDSFIHVIERFINWCGQNFLFCTWGDMDLIELQRNMQFYQMESFIDTPVKYYNIQKIFGICFEGNKAPKTLEYAVDYFNINKDMPFHRALSDANYTALIFGKIDIIKAEKIYSIDFFNNPKTKEDEIHLVYENYYKFISLEFDTKEVAMKDKEVTSTCCYKCNKKASKKIRWFSSNSKNYYSLSICKEHGYLRGKIRMKKAQDGKIYVIKILKLVDEEEAKKIGIKQEEIRERRRKKRVKNK